MASKNKTSSAPSTAASPTSSEQAPSKHVAGVEKMPKRSFFSRNSSNSTPSKRSSTCSTGSTQNADDAGSSKQKQTPRNSAPSAPSPAMSHAPAAATKPGKADGGAGGQRKSRVPSFLSRGRTNNQQQKNVKLENFQTRHEQAVTWPKTELSNVR